MDSADLSAYPESDSKGTPGVLIFMGEGAIHDDERARYDEADAGAIRDRADAVATRRRIIAAPCWRARRVTAEGTAGPGLVPADTGGVPRRSRTAGRRPFRREGTSRRLPAGAAATGRTGHPRPQRQLCPLLRGARGGVRADPLLQRHGG